MQRRDLVGKKIPISNLGFEVPDIGATDQARQTGHTGTYGWQWKAPVLALLGASKVTHQTTAGVG